MSDSRFSRSPADSPRPLGIAKGARGSVGSAPWHVGEIRNYPDAGYNAVCACGFGRWADNERSAQRLLADHLRKNSEEIQIGMSTTLPIPYVEQDCIIEHEGHSFSAGGAVVTPQFAIGYVCRHTPGTEPDGRYYGGLVLKNWRGDVILGEARVTARWKLPFNAWISDHMLQVEVSINGITYTGRCAGEGMLWRGKRKATRKSRAKAARA